MISCIDKLYFPVNINKKANHKVCFRLKNPTLHHPNNLDPRKMNRRPFITAQHK
jgi:hypothetical protein